MQADTQIKYLAEVENTYNLLEENFDGLYERCETEDDRQELRSLHDSARAAYFRGVGVALQDGNQVVHELYNDLGTTNKQIKTMIANLQSVASLLNTAKQAVKIAGTLVSLASAL